MNALRHLLFRASVHLYGVLLFLYPPEFRARFHTQMVRAFSDAYHEQVATKSLARGAVSVALLWSRELLGLLMSRNAGRDVEMAVRASMGAGRYRLVRQMLTESLILALIGGGGGPTPRLVGHRAPASDHPRQHSPRRASFY